MVIRSVVSVCPVLVLTFESTDLKLHFCYAGTSSEYLGKLRIARSSGQGQVRRSKNGQTSIAKYTPSRVLCL